MLGLQKIHTIDKNEAFRYLGIKGNADENTNNLFYECQELLIKAVKPRFVMSCFDIEINNDVKLLNTTFSLQGKDIKKHLANCEKAVLFCFTLSIEADRLINQMQITDIAKGVMLDFCASALVEQYCDQIENIISKQYNWNKDLFTYRFSPGYGDMPIESQSGFLRLLDSSRKIGLNVSANNILMPRKSVTAIVGLSKKQQLAFDSCEICKLKDSCELRKRGEHCGRERDIK